MLAKVDKNTCIGCGLCTSLCPEVFAMEDDGLAGVHTNPVPTEAEASAQEASDSCPVSAIQLEN